MSNKGKACAFPLSFLFVCLCRNIFALSWLSSFSHVKERLFISLWLTLKRGVNVLSMWKWLFRSFFNRADAIGKLLMTSWSWPAFLVWIGFMVTRLVFFWGFWFNFGIKLSLIWFQFLMETEDFAGPALFTHFHL